MGRKWIATSLDGCVGFVKGLAEWAVADADGGMSVCQTPTLEFAKSVADALNAYDVPGIFGNQTGTLGDLKGRFVVYPSDPGPLVIHPPNTFRDEIGDCVVNVPYKDEGL